jgi:hypothetical protein
LGGTIGLAQCGAVLNAKVSHYITQLALSGAISASDAQAISLSAAGLTSVDGLDGLPADIQQAVRDAFRQGTRFAFISLIPWCALSFLATLFLQRIPDGDGRQTVSPRTPVQMGQDKEKEVGATTGVDNELSLAL